MGLDGEALMAEAAPPRSWWKPVDTEWINNLLLTLPFLLLYWVDVAHHTLFFDEVNAWGIAAASPTPGTLLHYVHYEGHPWLWYFLLWVPSRFTHDPRAMLWVVVPIGTAIYLVIGLLSPFTRLQKVLIFLSYFVIFEYTVMNRMYGVMFLLALLYAWRRMRKPDGLIGNVTLLGAMANTDMTGFLLSSALLIEYAVDRWLAYRQTHWAAPAKRNIALSMVTYTAMVFVSIYTLLPATDISWQTSGKIGSMALGKPYILRVVVNLLASLWWPINPEFPRHFWETDSWHQPQLKVLAVIVVFAYWRIFRRDKALMLLMGMTIIIGILFADLVYVGRVRHWGIVFISFLVALWMQRKKRERAGERHAAAWSPWAYALMGLSVLAGLTATASSWRHPFSRARDTAEWIRKNEPADVALVGAPDVSFTSVVEELGRPVYFMECECVSTFKLFSRNTNNFLEEELPWRLTKAANYLHTRTLVFVFYRPLRSSELAQFTGASLKVEPLAQFTRADSLLENYYLYRITLQ